MNFVQYIASLAPEGETALIVLQKPQILKGVPLTHLDGTPKYTWPAYLPGKVDLKKADAWYINTGSFVLSKFKDRLSASRNYCDYVLVMMLDDIGTKSKVPPLPPTWIMETSEGSCQWGYTFSEQPTKEEYAAAITAIAKAGYTDPGATNAVRNFRIPGSINLKPGRGGFVSVLKEFHPEREYTLSEICTALEVIPETIKSTHINPVYLENTQGDEVLSWLASNNLVITKSNSEGWLGVVCPNHAQHSDGNPMARYKPATRGFCCYHGHCTEITSQIFLDWVHNNGGPKAKHGLRDEVISDNLRKAMETIPDAPLEVSTPVQEVLEQMKSKEISRLEKTEWYQRFAYIKDNDVYFDLETREIIRRVTFDALYRHIECRSMFGNRPLNPSRCFDENREAHGAKVFNGVTYAPGEEVACNRNGDWLANTWRDARAAVTKTNENITPWIAHCRHLVPNEDELNHIWDMMAFKLQNPKIKINHAVLHGGVQGCGKDTMWAPFIRAICGDHGANLGLVDNEILSGTWGDAYESEVLIINELYDPDIKERRALANKLKPIIAAPPDVINVNKKFMPMYSVMNRMFVLAFSNERVPIRIDAQDRRWFCVWSTARRMDSNVSQELWNWYHKRGFKAVAQWLYARDVSQFNPGAIPMMTEAKENLIEYSLTNVETNLVDMLRNREYPFTKGIVASPFNTVCDIVSSVKISGTIHRNTLFKALEEAGWLDCERVKSRNYTTKKHVFIHPDLADKYNNAELRDLAEKALETYDKKIHNVVPIAQPQAGSQKRQVEK